MKFTLLLTFIIAIIGLFISNNHRLKMRVNDLYQENPIQYTYYIEIKEQVNIDMNKLQTCGKWETYKNGYYGNSSLKEEELQTFIEQDLHLTKSQYHLILGGGLKFITF